MTVLKKLLFFSITLSTLVMSVGCSGGEADYSLGDITNISINQNINRTPSVFPSLSTSIVAVDVQDPVQNSVYTYTLSGEDSSFFSIDENGSLYFNKIPFYTPAEDADSNNVFEITITVSNGDSSASIGISVSIAEDADHVLPYIETTHIDYLENNSSSMSIQAISGTTAALTYSLDPGYDETLFSIDASTGLLSFVTTPDYENPLDSDADNTFMLTVRVTDQTGYANTITKTITISILDLVTPTALIFDALVATDGEGTDHYRIVDSTHLYTWWKNDYIRTYSVQLQATVLNNPEPLSYTLVSGASIFTLSTDGLLTIVLPKGYGDNADLPVVINVCNSGECGQMTLHVQTD